MLSQVIMFAALAHDGQKDKGGQPYILHPLRVMLAMETDEERIVAVLHDIVEDTEITFERLDDYGFSSKIIEALEHLTKRPDEAYIEFIQRVTLNPLAVKVKLADLRDNMDKSRIPKPTGNDQKRWEKYEKAYQILAAVTEQ